MDVTVLDIYVFRYCPQNRPTLADIEVKKRSMSIRWMVMFATDIFSRWVFDISIGCSRRKTWDHGRNTIQSGSTNDINVLAARWSMFLNERSCLTRHVMSQNGVAHYGVITSQTINVRAAYFVPHLHKQVNFIRPVKDTVNPVCWY